MPVLTLLAELYRGRKLSEGYPDLDRRALATYVATVDARPDVGPRTERLLSYFGRLIDLGPHPHILMLGCGPRPTPMRVLHNLGVDAVGVEPVPAFVQAAREYLSAPDKVLQGRAEDIPLPACSQDVVIFESVLEHVNSPQRSLQEIYRVLRPGGILFIITTNRFCLSLTGFNGEFNVPFFNWLPANVKESFVYFHLHFKPRLANYTEIPAVHWFSFSELCALGRSAGFSRFYSLLDLQRSDDVSLSAAPSRLRSLARGIVLRGVQASPWLRALALTFTSRGGDIIMLKQRDQ